MTTASVAPTDRWGPHADTLSGRSVAAMLAAGRLPHAMLITGPAGVGKRDLGLRIAQSLLCDSSEAAGLGPCRSCRDCLRLHDPQHPARPPQHSDVELVGPGAPCSVADHDHSNTRTIGICVVRRIEHTVTLAPFEADRRVILIDPADALTADAADAFLKTLEEPPEGVHFILITSQQERISETIRSRCRTITLAPLAASQLERWLEEWSPEAAQDVDRRAELIRLARGRPEWLQSQLRDGDPLSLRAAQIEDALRMAGASRAERLGWSEQVAGRGQNAQAAGNIELILDVWSDWWRDLWLSQAGRSDALVHVTQRARIAEHAALYDQSSISQFLERIERTRELLRKGVNGRLALDVLLLHIPHARTST